MIAPAEFQKLNPHERPPCTGEYIVVEIDGVIPANAILYHTRISPSGETVYVPAGRYHNGQPDLDDKIKAPAIHSLGDSKFVVVGSSDKETIEGLADSAHDQLLELLKERMMPGAKMRIDDRSIRDGSRIGVEIQPYDVRHAESAELSA